MIQLKKYISCHIEKVTLTKFSYEKKSCLFSKSSIIEYRKYSSIYLNPF